MKNTCWKCERRHVGYHATCEEYLAFKAEWEKIREARAKFSGAVEITCLRARKRRAFEAKLKQRGRFR